MNSMNDKLKQVVADNRHKIASEFYKAIWNAAIETSKDVATGFGPYSTYDKVQQKEIVDISDKSDVEERQAFEAYPDLAESIQHAACHWKTDSTWSNHLEQINKVIENIKTQKGINNLQNQTKVEMAETRFPYIGTEEWRKYESRQVSYAELINIQRKCYIQGATDTEKLMQGGVGESE